MEGEIEAVQTRVLGKATAEIKKLTMLMATKRQHLVKKFDEQIAKALPGMATPPEVNLAVRRKPQDNFKDIDMLQILGTLTINQPCPCWCAYC